MSRIKTVVVGSSALAKSAIWKLFVASFLIVVLSPACSSLLSPPSSAPDGVFDVLIPSSSVDILGFVVNGRALDDKGNEIASGVVVNPEFLLWVDALKSEIRRLRKEAK